MTVALNPIDHLPKVYRQAARGLQERRLNGVILRTHLTSPGLDKLQQIVTGEKNAKSKTILNLDSDGIPGKERKMLFFFDGRTPKGGETWIDVLGSGHPLLGTLARYGSAAFLKGSKGNLVIHPDFTDVHTIEGNNIVLYRSNKARIEDGCSDVVVIRSNAELSEIQTGVVIGGKGVQASNSSDLHIEKSSYASAVKVNGGVFLNSDGAKASESTKIKFKNSPGCTISSGTDVELNDCTRGLVTSSEKIQATDSIGFEVTGSQIIKINGLKPRGTVTGTSSINNSTRIDLERSSGIELSGAHGFNISRSSSLRISDSSNKGRALIDQSGAVNISNSTEIEKIINSIKLEIEKSTGISLSNVEVAKLLESEGIIVSGDKNTEITVQGSKKINLANVETANIVNSQGIVISGDDNSKITVDSSNGLKIKACEDLQFVRCILVEAVNCRNIDKAIEGLHGRRIIDDKLLYRLRDYILPFTRKAI